MIRKYKKLYRLLPHIFCIIGILLCMSTTIRAAGQPHALFPNKEAEAFISGWITLSEDNKNLDAVMEMYAEDVELFKMGTVKKSVIAEDKRKYFNRWPEREYRVTSTVIHPGASENEKQAEVMFHYKIRKGQKSLEGDARTLLLLRKTQGKIIIFGEKDLPTSLPSGTSVAGAEYLVWSGYGGTAWIDAQGTVMRRSKEKVPVCVVNGILYTVSIEKLSVEQADCDSLDFRNPDAKPKMVPATDLEFSLIKIDQDGREHKTILVKAGDNEEGSSSTELEVFGRVGPWLFVERRVFFDVCGAPHGVVPHELLVVNVETAAAIAAYRGQKKSEMEKDILGEGPLSRATNPSSITLLTEKEHQVVRNVLGKKALQDLEEAEDVNDIRLTRMKPVLSRDALGFEMLLTAPTGYTGSDGQWSSYTRSHTYPALFVPELLKPYQNIPRAVLNWWKTNKVGSYPSWSEVPSTGSVRQQLEKLFQ